jgi:hypothetical protein
LEDIVMKTTVTITIPLELTSDELGRLQYLLCDALGEFSRARQPAEQYLAERYPDVEGYKWLKRDQKLDEIKLRSALAEKLRNCCAGGIDVSVDHTIPSED